VQLEVKDLWRIKVKADTKIRGVQQNIGLDLVFSE
jgi:hypothetical protein